MGVLGGGVLRFRRAANRLTAYGSTTTRQSITVKGATLQPDREGSMIRVGVRNQDHGAVGVGLGVHDRAVRPVEPSHRGRAERGLQGNRWGAALR